MAISAILTAPASNEIRAAYQSTVIQVIGFANQNPVVYFDVYFNNKFYRTISRTAPYSKQSGLDWYQADISDTVQEFLQSFVMPLQTSNVWTGTGYASCFVKVRGSTNSSGLIVPEGPVPVQATQYTNAVTGGGLSTASFNVLNMVLQHEDPPDVITALTAGGNPLVTYAPSAVLYDYYPLSRNKKPSVTPDDFAYAPFYMHSNGAHHGGDFVRMFLSVEGHAIVYMNGTSYVSLTEERVYYLPYGIKNLQLMPGWGAATGLLGNAKRYMVGFESSIFNAMIFQTPFITIDRPTDNHKRIFFRNYLGQYEAINFSGSTESLITTSSSFQKMLVQTPPITSQKSSRGANRLNVRSNEVGTLLGTFTEDQMPLIAELAASPDVFLQTKGTLGQADDLIPIIIQDGETLILKNEERYGYDVAMKYTYGNPNIHTRN